MAAKTSNRRGTFLTSNNEFSKPTQRWGGSTDNVVFRECDTKINHDYVYGILKQFYDGQIPAVVISQYRPIKPSGGEMFIIDTETLTNKDNRRSENFAKDSDSHSVKHVIVLPNTLSCHGILSKSIGV